MIVSSISKKPEIVAIHKNKIWPGKMLYELWQLLDDKGDFTYILQL